MGFGSGLAPRAPGTVGTLCAVPLYLLLANLPLAQYTFCVLAAVVAGIFICSKASRELGVHDHPGIVWDEFAGFWLCMWAVPVGPVSLLLGFAVFRLLDIAKPWPISWCDKHVHGGLGIMLDDVVAGVAGCAVMHVLLAVLPGLFVV